ncbi:putative Crp/Fnr family transcriptional regulator [Marinobacter santoriniensis NKSG1]|uniref:Putative Crp/Fnr family transcriptional regulator n=1 Tax=Marinobacter santoriniensis NKSG1 TaxID=1288826 RepID=M7CRF5_9GAMM|nr:cyclic nucleotide-binding domain-containing protein [Marinobacter santoriniensis]EMP56221.1 putative Crp/Fnr family transcriptional regulator [Marinobacter santoriniensis NKSG1]
MKSIAQLVCEHPFFQGLNSEFCDLMCGCARNVRFNPGEYLFHQGEDADHLYLIRHGQVALELAVPGKSPVSFQTLHDGDVVGVSWVLPPYHWSSDARAMSLTRAIAMDAHCLRKKCDEDPALGYAVLKRLLPILTSRLNATQMQILDVYGAPEERQ